MTFSTRNNPRLAQSGVAMTSLGAVGGARGTAAGGLRILVEFLTTYDPGAINQLEQDLENLEGRNRGAAVEEEQRLRKLAGVRRQLAVIDNNIRNKADADVRREIRIQDRLQGVQTKAARQERALSVFRLGKLLESQGFAKKEIEQIQGRYALRRREATLIKQGAAAEERGNLRAQQRLHTEDQLTKLQGVRAKLAPRLAGLAIGAVGGILGGAILGVGFQLAEAAIEKVGEALQDLIDPARHAREEVKGLAEAVNQIANDQNIRQIEAAKQVVAGFGISPTAGGGANLAGLLAEVAVRQQIIDALKQEGALLDVQRNKETLDKELRQEVARVVLDEARANGTLREVRRKQVTEGEQYGTTYRQLITVTDQFIGELTLEEAVTRRLNSLVEEFTDKTYAQAQAVQRAAQAAGDASALWNVYAQSLASAIDQALQLQVAPIQNKIDNLGSGESARTRRLERRVAAPSGGGGGADRSAQLRNIGEERAIILLRQRLRLMGTAINLEKYSGKFLLEAINAKIRALQQEGQAQERINRLRDLQFRMGQEINRQEGESITAFIERRAQEQRDLLGEQDDLERERQIARLEKRKEVLEDELALEALAEQRREAMRSTGTSSHNSNLQKQLEASRAADRKALEEKKKALEKEIEAREKAAKEAIALTSESAMKETYAAIRGMQGLEGISQFSGRLAGLLRAKSAIQALVEGFGLPKWVAAPFLDKLNGMINAASARIEAIQRNVLPRGRNVPFQHGGVFALNNANHPFGSNIRAGEAGTELGIILSHNVAKILQNQKPGIGQVGPIYIQKSEDPYRDSYALRKAVISGVEGALE